MTTARKEKLRLRKYKAEQIKVKERRADQVAKARKKKWSERNVPQVGKWPAKHGYIPYDIRNPVKQKMPGTYRDYINWLFIKRGIK